MGAYLLTHSLMTSWKYLMRDNPFEDSTQERDPMEEFMATLRRERTPATPAMQDGIDFENLVTAICEGRGDQGHEWYRGAAEIAQQVRGGVFQYVAKKTVQIHGMEVLLYGRLDVLKAGVITDIKFCHRYERGKFTDSTQHPMYMELIPEAYQFTYQIFNGQTVATETFRREETPSIYPIAEEFYSWLETVGLMETYKKHWGAKK